MKRKDHRINTIVSLRFIFYLGGWLSYTLWREMSRKSIDVKYFPHLTWLLSFEVFHNELAGKRCDEIIENIDRVYKQVCWSPFLGRKAFDKELHTDSSLLNIFLDMRVYCTNPGQDLIDLIGFPKLSRLEWYFFVWWRCLSKSWWCWSCCYV